MSNWQYANIVPTVKWRSACTVPRELGLKKIGEKYMVTSAPVKELNILQEKSVMLENIDGVNYNLSEQIGKVSAPAKIHLTSGKIENFSITLSNEMGEQLVVG